MGAAVALPQPLPVMHEPATHCHCKEWEAAHPFQSRHAAYASSSFPHLEFSSFRLQRAGQIQTA